MFQHMSFLFNWIITRSSNHESRKIWLSISTGLKMFLEAFTAWPWSRVKLYCFQGKWDILEKTYQETSAWFPASALTYDRHRSYHSHFIPRKRLDKLSTNDFSWTHQRNKAEGPPAILQSGHWGIQRATASVYPDQKLLEPPIPMPDNILQQKEWGSSKQWPIPGPVSGGKAQVESGASLSRRRPEISSKQHWWLNTPQGGGMPKAHGGHLRDSQWPQLEQCEQKSEFLSDRNPKFKKK